MGTAAYVLEDLLDQRELGLELLTGGEQALRRPIAGAHAVELESPTRFLAPDWILLSAGPRLRGSRRAQRELVAELDAGGATALGFGIKPVFEHVPPALLAEARARAFPVFAVPPTTPFRDVVSTVNRCLTRGDLVNYERLTSMQRYLLDALREEHPERAVVERLAQLVDARVLVFDAGGELQLATGPAPAEQLWAALSPDHEVVQELDVDGWHLVAMPISTPGEPPPWLVVTSRRAGFVNRLTRPAAQATVPLMAAIGRLGEVARRQERAIRASLLNDLLALQAATPAEWHALAARAASFGVTFEQPARIVLARERAARADGEPGDLCAALERAFGEAGAPHLVGPRGPAAAALAQCGSDALQDALRPVLDARPALAVGLGRAMSHLAEAPHSLRDAELAVERLGYEHQRRVLAFEDFDLGTLLVSEAPRARVDPKIDELLTPLREHPLVHDAIIAYFEHEMDVGRTAQALCLHPNTLRYRLGRLEQLLGVSLKQPAAMSALYLALVAARTRQQPPPRAPAGD